MPLNNRAFSKLRNSPLFFIPILLFVGFALSSLAYILMMEGTGWKTESKTHNNPARNSKNIVNSTWLANIIDPNNGTDTVSSTMSEIYLFNSKKTGEHFAANGGDYEQILDQWHYYFDTRGIKYTNVENLTGELKPGTLILPSAVVLDSRERAAIKSFEDNGGSVIATWSTGARGDSGDWAGYGFLQEQFGIKVSSEMKAQDSEKFLVVYGETPVAYTLNAGSRIWLGLDEIHEYPLRVSGGENIAGRFMDAARSPGDTAPNEAIVYNETGASRRVYFSFAETSWRFDQKKIYTLLDDTLNWLQRRPDDYLGNWPYPYRAAQIVEMDTEQGYPNATNFADQLNSYGYSGTFYSLTSVASHYPEVVRQLETRHEIAYHGDVHDAFRGQSRDIQSQRLDNMQQELRPVVANPAKLTGFRPPYELSDEIVESLLFKKGFRHILRNSDETEAMLPYLSSVSPKDFTKGLIVLPRTQRDDMNLIKKGVDTPEMIKAMNMDFDQTREFGGLGILSVHSQNFETDSPIAKSTAAFLAHIKSSGNKTWVAPSGAIETWWRERSLFKSRLTGTPNRMLLNITVKAPGTRHDISLIIINPERDAQLKIRVAKVSMTQPVAVPLDAYRTAVVFHGLSAGDYSYYLSY